MRPRSPRNCRKTTPGTVVGFRWRISAAIKSRGRRSASEERRRNRKPLGGPRSKRSENRGIMAQSPQDWLSRHRAGLPSYSYEVTERPFHISYDELTSLAERSQREGCCSGRLACCAGSNHSRRLQQGGRTDTRHQPAYDRFPSSQSAEKSSTPGTPLISCIKFSANNPSQSPSS
jgi:hypothetical protein